ncbi:hypothetical protein NTGM5_90001 [Candidatus Nitrotoga sp. M5]|nr:hypothetical protein NTGM5_90001 [Candidatus Nitrotoga sp. M5]
MVKDVSIGHSGEQLDKPGLGKPMTAE